MLNHSNIIESKKKGLFQAFLLIFQLFFMYCIPGCNFIGNVGNSALPAQEEPVASLSQKKDRIPLPGNPDGLVDRFDPVQDDLRFKTVEIGRKIFKDLHHVFA